MLDARERSQGHVSFSHAPRCHAHDSAAAHWRADDAVSATSVRADRAQLTAILRPWPLPFFGSVSDSTPLS